MQYVVLCVGNLAHHGALPPSKYYIMLKQAANERCNLRVRSPSRSRVCLKGGGGGGGALEREEAAAAAALSLHGSSREEAPTQAPWESGEGL